MPLQATSGAASYDAFGGGVAAVPNYIEECFSTTLYTGNGSTQTITNGIDLSTKGGLVWIKNRDAQAFGQNYLMDTVRGIAGGWLSSNLTNAQSGDPGNLITAYNADGFTEGGTQRINASGTTYASWTFREQPKFFDVVTFTTDGTGAATVSHALGSTPAFVIVKRTDSTGLWFCWHTSLPSTNYYLFLNLTNAQTNSGGTWLTPSSTQVSFPSNTSTGALDSSANYVMYVYASNAGGFGLTGTDNVISCGSYTGNGSSTGPEVNIGYEPQWLLIKQTSSSGNSWSLYDNMRGLSVAGPSGHLRPNDSAAEDTTTIDMRPTATGFQPINSTGRVNGSGSDYIYIAIRRGPMKVPTSGTKVFKPVSQNGAGTVTTGFPVSLVIAQKPDGAGANWQDRLRGGSTNSYNVLYSYSTNAEASSTGAGYGFDNNTGYVDAFNSSAPRAYWNFQRAPSFFDVVCWTPNGSANDRITHNLSAPPELIITRTRSPNAGDNWWTYSSSLGRSSYLALNTTDAASSLTDVWGTSNPTSTDFGMKDTAFGYDSTYREVAYLFATCAGVSKVGSYTGNGSTQTIDCGFGAGGARFVLIKRTDSTGGWYVYDTARGMTVLTDPYLFLNNQDAEAATLGSVTTVSTGFALNSSVLAAINVSGGTYIFLAIA